MGKRFTLQALYTGLNLILYYLACALHRSQLCCVVYALYRSQACSVIHCMYLAQVSTFLSCLACSLRRYKLSCVLPCIFLTLVSTLLCLTLQAPYTSLNFVASYLSRALHRSRFCCLTLQVSSLYLTLHNAHASRRSHVLNFVVSYLAPGLTLHRSQLCCLTLQVSSVSAIFIIGKRKIGIIAVTANGITSCHKS